MFSLSNAGASFANSALCKIYQNASPRNLLVKVVFVTTNSRMVSLTHLIQSAFVDPTLEQLAINYPNFKYERSLLQYVFWRMNEDL